METTVSIIQEIKISEGRLIDIHSEIVGIHNQTEFVKDILVEHSGKLNEILKGVNGQLDAENNLLEETRNLSSVVKGEIISITNVMSENNKLMIRKFDEFSELMRKNNVEALVEVMRRVTEEFNKQMKDLINKLVQENFEELNRSVERLNVWQQENKQMITNLTVQYQNMTVEFKDTSTILHEVADKTHVLIEDEGKLKRLIDELQRVLIDDKKFEEITNKLTKTISEVHEGTEAFDKATTELNMWIQNHRDLGDGVLLLVRKLDELNRIRDYNEQFWQETKKSLNEGVSIIAGSSKALNDSVSVLNDEFYERLNGTLANLDSCIQAIYDRRKN